MRLRHATDTHLGRPGGKGAEALAFVVETMLSPGNERDLLALTGDVGDLDESRRLLAPIRGRVIACIGNHDQSDPGPIEGVTYSSKAEQRFNEFLDWLGSPRPGSTFCPEGTDLAFLPLDSCRKTRFVANLARGRLGVQQFRRLAAAKKIAADHCLRLIILLHHDIPDADPTMRLEDGDRFLREAYGVAWMILNGHTHGPERLWTSTQGFPTLLRRGQDAVGGGAGSVGSVEL